jgi:hypothetical protein
MLTIQKQIQVYHTVCDALTTHWKRKKLPSAVFTALNNSLESLGLQQDQVSAINLWIVTHWDDSSHSPIQHRILHELEKDVISVEAYGIMIQAVYLGLLQWSDLEEILEELLSQEIVPVHRKALEKLLAERWFKQFANSNFQIH